MLHATIGLARLRVIILLSLLSLVAARPVEAQLGDRIVRSAREKVEERKERTKENVVQRATEPVDSTLERIAAPVDSVVGRAAAGAAVTVSRVGRSRASEIEAEARRMSEELAATGRVEVPGIAFAIGLERPEPGSGTPRTGKTTWTEWSSTCSRAATPPSGSGSRTVGTRPRWTRRAGSGRRCWRP